MLDRGRGGSFLNGGNKNYLFVLLADVSIVENHNDG